MTCFCSTAIKGSGGCTKCAYYIATCCCLILEFIFLFTLYLLLSTGFITTTIKEIEDQSELFFSEALENAIIDPTHCMMINGMATPGNQVKEIATIWRGISTLNVARTICLEIGNLMVWHHQTEKLFLDRMHQTDWQR